MSDVESKGNDPLTPSATGRFEDACDRFESQWRAGGRPRIEDYCNGNSPARTPLIRELLVVELTYRRQLGETPLPDEYQARFPCQSAAIRDAFETSTRFLSQVDAALGSERPEVAALANEVDSRPKAAMALPESTRDYPALADCHSAGTTTSSGGRFRIIRLLERGGLGEVYVCLLYTSPSPRD